MQYSDKLRDPRWQKKRLEVMQRAEFKCEECSDSSSTLHVHHRYYVSGKNPWDYPERELTCICETCHETHHDQLERLLYAFNSLPDAFWREESVSALLRTLEDYDRESKEASA